MGIMIDLLRRDGVYDCTKKTCPASDSIYGYAPNLGANAFFIAVFAISSITFCYQAFLYRKWKGFSIAMILGTALECVGYGSRIMLSKDPFSDTGFKLNIVLLTFAPAFLTAGIYLLLKQLVYTFGPQYSILRPAWYTYIFITCDVLAIALQGAGGGISSGAADNDHSTLKLGVNVMIAGLSSQVATLTIFGALAAYYFFRVWQHKNELPASTYSLRHQLKFKLFLGSTTLAFLLVFIRCSYRIAELKDGWGSTVMRNENEFIGLDSVMIAAAAILLNVFHPGFCYGDRSRNTDIDVVMMEQKRESDNGAGLQIRQTRYV